MFNKKIMVLMIFIVSILAVSAVSAAENTDGYLDVPVANDVEVQQVVTASSDDVNLTASDEVNHTLQYTADDFITLYSDVHSDDDLVCAVSDLDSEFNLNGFVTVYLEGTGYTHTFELEFDKTCIPSYNIAYKDLGNEKPLKGQYNIHVSYNRAYDGKEYVKKGKINFFTDGPIESNSFTDLLNLIDKAEDSLSLTHDYIYCEDKDFNLINGVLINKDITIDGKGVTIDGNNQAMAFSIIFADVTLKNIFFVNCYSSNSGGAINSFAANITLNNVTFVNSTAGYGGSIYVAGGNLDVNDSVFANSSSNYAPAIFVTQGDLKISNSKFMNLKANISAGAVAIKSFKNLNIENSCFDNTHSAKNGGAVFIDGSDDGESHGNSHIKNVSFVNTSGDFGGAFMQLGGNLEMRDLTFTNCTSKYDGGAAYLSGLNATIGNAEFNSNKVTSYDDYPTFGGALYVDNANLTITNSKFIHNSAYEGSGAVGIYDSSYKIINTQFNNNGEAIFAVFKGQGSEIINLTGSDTVSDDNVFLSLCDFRRWTKLNIAQ